MKKTKMITRAAALGLASIIALTGCGAKATTSESAQQSTGIERLNNKDELIYASRSFESIFDPSLGWGQYGDPLIQSKLIAVKNTSLVNDLATSYTVSEDGLTWVFKIQDGVKFHDGQPLTAEDVAFTFNNTKALASKIDLTAMDKATALDDTTVEFKMLTPFSTFLYTVASLGIVPEHAYESSDAYSKNPIGSGPMKFVQYDEGQQLILERNEDYYGKKPEFKRLIMIMMDQDSAFAAVKAGQVDIATTNQAFAQNQVDGYNVKAFETYDYRVISFPVTEPGGKTDQGDPMGNPVTSDPALRKALSLGISRDNIVENVLNGYGELTFDVFSKFPWGIGEEVKSLEDGNLEEAGKILDEGGWIMKDGVREKDGVRAEFNLMYGIEALDRQAIALSFAEEAKKLGIIVTPLGLDWSEIEKRAKVDPMVLGGGQYNPMNITRLYDSKYAKETGWGNVIGYSNLKTDEYIQKAITATDEATANEYWKKVLWDGQEGPGALGEMVYVPVCYINHLFFVRDGLTLGDDIILPHDNGTGILGSFYHWDYSAPTK